MFDFIKKIKAGLNKFGSKRVFFIAFLAFALFAVPNISEALSLNPITILSESLGGLALGISWLIGLIGSTIVGILIWVLQIVVLASDGIVNSPAVQIGFPIILSIANLGFVITIIVIAIATIIRNQTYNIKKLLVNVIIMAVMVNFGLVISGAILGVSSRITNYFLSSMTGGTMKLASTISGIVQPQKAITSLSPDKKVPATEEGTATATTTSPADQIPVKGTTLGSFVLPITGVWLSLIMVVFLIIAFFSLIASFVIRYLKLIFLLILLPAAWMGSVLPGKTSGWSSTWWKKFNELAFYPPIVLFFLWLALRIGESAANSETFKIPVEGDTFLGPMLGGVLQELLNQIVLVGIILGGDYAAKYASSEASQKATNTALKMQGWATGKVKRAGTRAGTRTGTAVLGSRPMQAAVGGFGTLGAKMSNVGLSGKGGKIRQTAGKIFGAPVRGIGGLAVVGQASIKGGEKSLSEQAGKSYRDEFSKMGDDELLIRAKAAKSLERAAILEKAAKDPKLMAKLMNVPGFKDGVNKDVLAEKDLYTRYGFKDAREGALVQSGYALKQAAEYEAAASELEEQKKKAEEKGETEKVKEIEEKIKAEKSKREFTSSKDVVAKMSKETIASFLSPDSKNLPAGMDIGGEELKNAQTAIISGMLKGSVSKFTSVIQELESKDKLQDFVKAVDISGVTEEAVSKGFKNSIEKGALSGITSYEELFAKAIEKGPKPSQWKGMSKKDIAEKIRKDNPGLNDTEILKKVNAAEEEAEK